MTATNEFDLSVTEVENMFRGCSAANSPTGGQCTSNFVFFNAGHVYLGQAAHCSTTSGATTTNILLTGCDSCAFSLYDHDLAPTTDVSAGQGKVISIAWNCSGTALSRTNTEYMQQSQIVIRNQP